MWISPESSNYSLVVKKKLLGESETRPQGLALMKRAISLI